MSDVKTYQMDPKDQEKRKKRSPAFYIECRQEGMLDKDIAKAMGVKPAYLSQLKGRWDFIGKSIAEMKSILKKETKNRRIKNGQEPKPEPVKNEKPAEEPAPEKDETSAPDEPKSNFVSADHHNAVVEEWQKKWKKEKEDLNHIAKERDEWQEKHRQETVTRMSAQDEASKLRTDNDELKTILQSKEDRAQGWKEQHDNLMVEYNTLNEKYQALEEESAPRHTITELENNLKKESLMNNDLRNRNRDLQDQLIEATKRANYYEQRDHHLYELVKLG